METAALELLAELQRQLEAAIKVAVQALVVIKQAVLAKLVVVPALQGVLVQAILAVRLRRAPAE